MCKTFQKEFGRKLKLIRKTQGLSQEELYFLSSVSRSHIGMIENGKRDVTLTVIFKLSRALNINLSDLFNFDDLDKYVFKNKSFDKN